MSNISIREITLDNLREAINLRVAEEQAGFIADNVTSIAWSRFLPNLIPAGIYDGDTMVGFVLYGEWDEFPGLWGIARFMVDSRHQGKGYGKAGMKELIRVIKEKSPGARALNLSYVPENRAARNLYRSLGFKETGEMRGREIEAELDLSSTTALP